MRLSPHLHSGRRLAHHHTSYRGLLLVLMLAAAVVALALQSAQVARASDAVTVGAIVPYPAPKTAPTIDSPANQSRIGSLPVTVAGLCSGHLIVEVFLGDVAVGSAACQSGAYSLAIDLVAGANTLVARHYTPDNQAGPDSNRVTLTYQPPAIPTRPAPAASPAPGGNPAGISPLSPGTKLSPGRPGPVSGVSQLLLHSPNAFVGADANHTVNVRLEPAGGRAPYALSVDWKDGTDPQLISRPTAEGFSVSHRYRHVGNYQITFTITDQDGRSAILQLVVVVGGVTSPPVAAVEGGISLWAWPVYILVMLMFLSFWMGERYEKRQLARLRQPA